MLHILVEADSNPSSDYFLKPALGAVSTSLTVVPLGQKTDFPVIIPTESYTLIFNRYLTPAWRRWVDANRAHLDNVIYFMDDDLLDLAAQRGLPWRYRWKLFRLAWRHRRWLRQTGAELWVSSQWLADKYTGWSASGVSPRVLLPQSPYGGLRVQNTLFYHGSASHADEIRWLVPVITEVLARDPSLSFEIIGDQSVRRLFAHVPRVHVLQAMSWPAYQALLSRPGRTIGLAPLLNSPFNHARAPVKFFDITQAGAVGVYADHKVYRSVVEHGRNGVLLPMEPALWADTILRLNADAPLRATLLSEARRDISACPDV
jgi:hypothetical protein